MNTGKSNANLKEAEYLFLWSKYLMSECVWFASPDRMLLLRGGKNNELKSGHPALSHSKQPYNQGMGNYTTGNRNKTIRGLELSTQG